MAKFISYAIVGYILAVVGGLLLGGGSASALFLWAGGIGAFLGGLAALPVPAAVKGTLAGAPISVVVGGVVIFFLPFTKGLILHPVGLAVWLIVGMICGGLVGHNMASESGEGSSE